MRARFSFASAFGSARRARSSLPWGPLVKRQIEVGGDGASAVLPVVGEDAPGGGARADEESAPCLRGCPARGPPSRACAPLGRVPRCGAHLRRAGAVVVRHHLRRRLGASGVGVATSAAWSAVWAVFRACRPP